MLFLIIFVFPLNRMSVLWRALIRLTIYFFVILKQGQVLGPFAAHSYSKFREVPHPLPSRRIS